MIVLGDGDDCVEIKNFAEIYTPCLDFGDGDDTLVLNGSLNWRGYSGCEITGLEKISGSGTLAIAGSYGSSIEIDKNFLNLLQNSDIKIVNTLGGEFAGAKEELGDNTINGQYVQTKDRNSTDGFDIWLCGKNVADSVDYGFADEVDYVKFVKSSGMNFSLDLHIFRMDGDYYDQSAFEDFSLQLLDSRGNLVDDLSDDIRMAMADGWSYTFDVSTLKNGTYYAKFATTANAAYCGSVGV